MKGGIGNLMKQAQKMQEDMQKAQQEIAEMTVTGNSGGGMVSVVMNGVHERCCRWFEFARWHEAPFLGFYPHSAIRVISV